jgi:hypothetical protein
VKKATGDPRMIMLRMTVEIESAESLLQHRVAPGPNLLEKASVTITALRGTSQPGLSSVRTNLKRDTVVRVCTAHALTSVNTAQPRAPWQASVASK